MNPAHPGVAQDFSRGKFAASVPSSPTAVVRLPSRDELDGSMIPVMEVWPSNRPLASPSSIPATLERYYAVPPAPLPMANTTLPQLEQANFSSAFDSDSSLTELEFSDSELSDSDESTASGQSRPS